MSKRSSDDFDNDHTDELPVLLETAALEDDPRALAATQTLEDTGEHRVLYHTGEPQAGTSGLHAALAERTAQLTSVEAQVTALATRGRELEQQVAEREQLIGELRRTAATLHQSAEVAAAADRRVAAQLSARDARIAELTGTVERLQRESAARATEIDRLRVAADAARRDAAALKSELEAKSAEIPLTPDLQGLLEDNATLSAYIAGRRAWWDQMQAEQTNLAAKVAALEDGLAVGAKRLVEAEAAAARESERATALGAELSEQTRRVAMLEDELQAARAAAVVPAPEANAIATPSQQNPSPSADASIATAREPPADGTAADDSAASAAPDTGATPAPAEVLVQLQAEVEYTRQQVTGQVVELRDRDQRLHAATNELERLRREISTLRNELEESRSTATRLERAVIDKDRGLEARDARIVTLHNELKLRLGALEKLNSLASKLSPPAPARADTAEPAADSGTAPALLCLTGDAPKRFPLTKKTVTIGRGPKCDLQILTHFVSREHARITLTGGSVVVEDLGSRNGVFVNTERVERQVLRQGDLVTVGETQFRFMESMEH